eukprot:650137_1
MMKHTMMSINQRECDLMRSFEHFPLDFIANLLDLNAFSDEFLMKQKRYYLKMGRDMNREYKYYKCKEIASDFGQFTLVNVVQEEVMTFRTISTEFMRSRSNNTDAIISTRKDAFFSDECIRIIGLCILLMTLC